MILFSVGEPLVTSQDGSAKTLFTNVTLRQFSEPDTAANATIHIFLSEYSPTYVDVEKRRARLREELHQGGGEPLKITALEEGIVGVTDFTAAMKLCEYLLRPSRPIHTCFMARR